jgi:hypothetical protein
MCCDKVCLRELGLDGCEKQRKYYFGLSQSERNILLQGCIQNNKGYCVNDHVLFREGFKKLFFVGNNRLQKVNANVFQRIENITFCKDTSSTQLGLVQWLDDFFSRNVESLPNKDIHHLPDNWTKLEVYEEFKHETNFREEQDVTYSWFCRIWSQKFSRVRIPKRSRFSTCAPCTEFKALREKATLETEKFESI